MEQTNEKRPQPTKPAYCAFHKSKITTKDLAEALNVQQQSIRAALCRSGHYLGLIPVKLPNRRMLWDAMAVTRLMNGGGA